MTEEIKDSAADNSRRNFIKTTALAAAGFMIVPRHVLGKGYLAPSDRLQVAGIGVGGKGESDLTGVFKGGRSDIAFLCDVDDRRAANSVKRFPKAKYYKDYRQMLDKESKNIDGVVISTPDHNHAMQAMAAMQLGKHVYVQKPLTHDIYEARMLTEAAKKYQVVTQMGNQGASGEGVRKLKDWLDAGLIGKVHTVYCWTDRPVWPQGISWPATGGNIPAELDWDLWLGSAPFKPYVEKLVPFNWRGWWDYGTGAIGDMGCHLVEPPFRILELDTPTSVECSVGSVYVDEFKRGYFPESCPPSSHVIMTFDKTKKTKGNLQMHWMDGGIKPERPEEMLPNESFGDNGTLFIGTRGKMICDTYGANPRLLPLTKNASDRTKPKATRVPGDVDGHYTQWAEAAIAGYGKIELSSPFEIAGPLTETLLIANLAIRGIDVKRPKADGKGFTFPGRDIKMLWDKQNMKVTNFDEVNQFVKREYRKGWSLGV
ncbi:Gfo/Idh/MocA family oxidoreductase [Pedobacter sp. HDW13]|uniref:Gfo/Idh/MocA family protein n=1 Tax=unclassified Pedobacter TaxID=2628915 RepID=UPI000F5B777E|nr:MULTISPECIES: Gfo/Idh/MocA family oxidoreductase [unclassified Pedobacter]QIL40206.1 Gfo/Idh/MocA family oxidoreductase [Pedobacter sp. HDW13]RQO79295.1 oxidoreductase [Pedobacter sp. KBW01]